MVLQMNGYSMSPKGYLFANEIKNTIETYTPCFKQIAGLQGECFCPARVRKTCGKHKTRPNGKQSGCLQIQNAQPAAIGEEVQIILIFCKTSRRNNDKY